MTQFHSSCGGEFRVTLELGGTQGSSQLVVGAPLELSWVDSCLEVMCRVAPVLLQWQVATH